MGRGAGGILKSRPSNSVGSGVNVGVISDRIDSIIKEVIKKDFTTRDQAFAIGNTDSRILAFAAAEGLTLDSGDMYSGKMYFSGKELNHAYRKKKREKGICADQSVTRAFPRTYKSMDLYWDGECFIYTDYKNKYILQPNYEIKMKRSTKDGKITTRTRLINLVSATKVAKAEEFNQKKYRKL